MTSLVQNFDEEAQSTKKILIFPLTKTMNDNPYPSPAMLLLPLPPPTAANRDCVEVPHPPVCVSPPVSARGTRLRVCLPLAQRSDATQQRKNNHPRNAPSPSLTRSPSPRVRLKDKDALTRLVPSPMHLTTTGRGGGMGGRIRRQLLLY